MPGQPGIGSKAPTVSRAATGGGQAGPSAIVQMLAQQQGEQMKKLMIAMQKMEQRNAEAISQASQAGAGAATQVANQVAQGLEKANKAETRERERGEDKQFSQDMAELQSRIQQDAIKEANSMGLAIQGQREAIVRFRQTWMKEEDEYNAAVAAFEVRTLEMLANHRFSSKEGRKELATRLHHADMMRTSGEDHFSDAHLEGAMNMANKNLAKIGRGEDGMDLRQMRVEPVDMPMVTMPGNPRNKGKRLVKKGEWDKGDQFKWSMGGGYPPDGLFGTDKPNWGAPEGVEPKFVNADLVLKAYQRADMMRTVQDSSLRDELRRKEIALAVETRDGYTAGLEMYDKMNENFQLRAAPALERGIDDFFADEDPTKWDDPGMSVVMHTWKWMLGGGEAGEKGAVLCAEIYDGKKELASPEEFTLAAMCESMAYNAKDAYMSEIQNSGEEGSLVNRVIGAMQDSNMSDDDIAASLGVPPGSRGMVQGMEIMQNRIAEWGAQASNTWTTFREQGILKRFREGYGNVQRDLDLFIAEGVINEKNMEGRLASLMSAGDTREGIDKGLEGRTSEEIEGRLDDFGPGGVDAEGEDLGVDTPFEEYTQEMNTLAVVVALSDEIGVGNNEKIRAWLGDIPTDNPNIGAYRQVRLDAKKNPVEDSFVGAVEYDKKRSDASRAERLKFKAERKGASGPGPTVSQQFSKEGAKAVAGGLPVRVSSTIGKAFELAKRLAVGTTLAAHGPAAAGVTAHGINALSGTAPAMTKGEAQYIKANLTGSEAQQITDASNTPGQIERGTGIGSLDRLLRPGQGPSRKLPD